MAKKQLNLKINWGEQLAKLDRYVKLATSVEGDPKAPFSIASRPRCKGGHYSIPRIAWLYAWSSPYNTLVLSKAASSIIFWVFGMTRPEIAPRSPGPLTNTQVIKPMALLYIYIYM